MGRKRTPQLTQLVTKEPYPKGALVSPVSSELFGATSGAIRCTAAPE